MLCAFLLFPQTIGGKEQVIKVGTKKTYVKLGTHMQQLTKAGQAKTKWVSICPGSSGYPTIHGNRDWPQADGLSRDTQPDPVRDQSWADYWAASRPQTGHLQWWETKGQEEGCRHGKDEIYNQDAWETQPLELAASWPCTDCTWAESILGLGHLGDVKVEARENSCTGRGKLWWETQIPGWTTAQHCEGLRKVTLLTAHLPERRKGFLFLEFWAGPSCWGLY